MLGKEFTQQKTFYQSKKIHLREIEKYIFISSPPIVRVLVIQDGYRGMGHAWK
jgi:hypothetical protein